MRIMFPREQFGGSGLDFKFPLLNGHGLSGFKSLDSSGADKPRELTRASESVGL